MRPLKMAATRNAEADKRPSRRRSSPSSFTGQESIADLVAVYPELRLLFLSYGICSCCVGDATLRMSAEVRGIPWETMLDDIRRELGKSG